MAIEVTCRSCGRELRVADKFAGKRGKCPRCGHTVEIPPGAVRKSGEYAEPVVQGPELPAVSATPPPVVHSPATPTGASPTASSAGSSAARRRRRRGAPVWAWFMAGAVVMLGALGWAAYDRFGPDLRRADRPGAPKPLKLNTDRFAPAAAPTAPVHKPGRNASLPDIVAYVKHGIVKLETFDRWDTRSGLGSGFVIDPAGWVATNYHVVEDAVKADVLFNDGTRYGVEGYVAVAPELDLAILKLNGAPPNMQSLDLSYRDAPRDASQVYAIGHPHDHEFNTTGGIVGRVLHTSELPEETQYFLQSFMSDSTDPVWIQHDARISEGNSGGPLLNAEGEVVGINTWINREIGLGYALHARHIHDVLQRPLPAVASLLQYRRRSGTNRAAAEISIASSDNIRSLAASCTARNWQAQNDAQYSQLTELARQVTLAKYLEEHDAGARISGQERIALSEEADAVIAALAGTPWKLAEHVHPVNSRLIVEDMDPIDGLFAFATIEQMIEGEDDRLGLVIKLVDLDQRFFIPLERRLTGLLQSDQVLVLGVLLPAKYEVDGDDAQAVPVLLSSVVLPVKW